MNQTVLSVFGLRPTRIGGTESYARELSLQLNQRGWKSVLCFEAFPSAPVWPYLDVPNASFEAIRNVGQAARRTIAELDRLLRRHEPAILHLHYTDFLSLYPWLARFHGVKKVFLTDHTSRPEGHVIRQAPAWKRLMTRVIAYPMTSVISISDYNRRCIVDAGLLADGHVVRIYNAVDLGRRQESLERRKAFTLRYGIPDGRTIVLQVSWIIPEKGVDDFLNAARIVLECEPNVHFVLAGEGRFREFYTRRAEDFGIGNYLSWTGLVTDPFAEGLYDAADVVCQMSRWEEGFGWVIAEAMACGKPVVATRVGGIPEIVRDGITGFLVNRGDSLAMADAVTKLIQEPELRNRLGAAGRAVTENEFDLGRYVGEVLRLYGISKQ